MSFLRSLLFNVFFFAATLVLTLVPGTVVRLVTPHRMLDVARLWAWVVITGLRIICGIRLEVSGLKHLRGDGAKLIASRHQSAFDTMVWLLLVPRCCYVLKHELLRIPLFGGLIPLTGMIAVDRSGGAAALRSLLREGDRAVREQRRRRSLPRGPLRRSSGVAWSAA